MFSDIRRICERPTAEDREWFPDIAGADWRRVLDFAMRNYKDESFIAQYLSPRLMREFHLFAIADREDEDALEVDCIHNDAGYRRLRRLLAQQYDRDARLPDIQVVGYDRDGSRSLTLRHRQHRGRPLAGEYRRVLDYMQRLWGFPVRFETAGADGEVVARELVGA
jgi:stage V sporulation protein R